MNNISGKINLAALKCAFVKGKSGQLCIVLPLVDNGFFVSEKEIEGKIVRNVYLDMIGFPVKNPKADSKDTHIVSQSLGKEKTAALKAQTPPAYPPTLGNFMVWGDAAHTEQNNAIDVPEDTPTDDLPF